MKLDKAVWDAIAAGDQHAYAEVYRSMYERLYNYGRKFSSAESTIEDAIQETLMLVWTKRKSLRGIEYPVTYFFTSFRNTLFTRLKSDDRFALRGQENDELEFAVDHFIINREMDSEATRRIEDALKSLTSRQREAIFLRFYEGMSYEDVATMLGITVKATYKIVARALDEMRQVFHITPGFALLFLKEFWR